MLKIGCHLSSAKGFLNMGKEIISIGGNTFQFFTRNPRGGKAKDIDKEDVEKLLKLMKENNFSKILAHAPYTLNGCSKDEKTREIFNKFTKEELRLIFIVSDVELVSSSVGNDYEVTSTLVEHHTGCKCERCWNFFSSLEEVEGFKVCSRCKEVLING